MLGSTTFLLPFVQHNQCPRPSYAAGHFKQGITTYISNFNNRMDSSAHLLHYPERPLQITRLNKIMNNHKIGTGHNVIVAITAYNGYNQEDAVIANKSSLESILSLTTSTKLTKISLSCLHSRILTLSIESISLCIYSELIPTDFK